MANPARRGFAVAALALAALAILAVGTGADGKNERPKDDPMKVAMAAVQKANLQGLRNALMPLLLYVKGGQPRDALRSMAEGTGTTVSPAAMQNLQDGVRTALDALDTLPVVGGAALRSRDAARAATELYGEAIGIAADAARVDHSTDPERRKAVAAAGIRVLSLGDALFDQSRRLSGGEFGRPGDILINTPAPVPDLDPKTKFKFGDEKAIGRLLAQRVRTEAAGAIGPERAERLKNMADRLLKLAH